MKKLIVLVLALICVLSLVGCGQKKQDLSFLNYENLVSIAAQSETLSVVSQRMRATTISSMDFNSHNS